MEHNKGHKLIIFGTVIAYCLIGVEIIVMISPFALYFYSVYGPILGFLSDSPLTSWTTEFFLPHMVFPDDSLLNAISYLQLLLVIGLILFLTAAVPLYYGRFAGHGVVQRSFYAKIRHPQYLFLAISGFGLLLYWPRFIILIMYITMLFVYYLLARNEEWRMQNRHPGSYAEYMRNIPMFLPGEPGGRIYRSLLGWIQPKWLGITVLYVLSLLLSVILAMGVRGYAVGRLPVAIAADSMTLVPVFPRPGNGTLALYDVVRGNQTAQGYLATRKREANLVYIMPGDFFLTALVTDKERRFSDEMIERFPEILEWHQHKFSGGLGRFFRIFYNFVKTIGKVETNYEIERLIFVRVQDGQGHLVGPSGVFDLGMKRTPVLIVDIDAQSHKLLNILPTNDNHKWGRMPMPVF